MPSTRDPSGILTGPGKLHMDVASASADLFTTASSALLTNLSASLTGELAVPNVTATFTAGGAETSRLLSQATYGPFYVGDSGGDQLKDLFTVVNASDDTEIFSPLNNSYISVTSITPASVGSGFYSAGDLTINFNTPIPTSVQYKVYFGKRGTLAAIPKETAVNPVIRRAINRVRFPEFERTGLAPTSIAQPFDTVTNKYPDPYMAHWRAVLRGTTQSVVADFGGHNGFVYVGRKKNVQDGNDQSLRGHQAAAFLAVYEKSIASGTLGGQTVWTKIDPSLTAQVIAADVIECNASDYFYLTGPNRTSVRCGVDMIEVTYPTTGIKEVYLVSGLVNGNPRRVTVTTLGGAVVGFSTQSVTIKWIRTGFFAGGDNDFDTVSTDNYYKGLGHFVPGAITASPAAEVAQMPPFFSSGTIDTTRADSGRNSWNIKAFTWGGFTENAASVALLGRRQVKGELWGDGSVQSYGGRIQGLHANRGLTSNPTVSSNTTYSLNPTVNNQVRFDFSGSSTAVLTLNLDAAYTPTEGDMITVFVSYIGVTANSNGELSSVTWDTEFKFSGNDAQTPSPSGTVIKYQGHMTNGLFYMTRTDYQTGA